MTDDKLSFTAIIGIMALGALVHSGYVDIREHRPKEELEIQAKRKLQAESMPPYTMKIFTPGIKPENARSYIELTDIDGDGLWDVREDVTVGYSYGSFQLKLYVRRGAPSIGNYGMDVETVNSDFFKPYQP